MCDVAKMKKYSYAEVTDRATAQIFYYMRASKRCSRADALSNQLIAYGVYMGWRALVESYPDQASYLRDDRFLESLIYSRRGESSR